MPFILSGVCSLSEANYCSNPFEVFVLFLVKLILVLYTYLTSTTKIMLGLFQLPFGGPEIEGILLVFLIRRPAKLTTTAV